MPEQVLQIDPQNELKFTGPFKVPVTSYMMLTNPSEKRVVFKIKTTAPKKYCVRPNSGILEPSETTKLAICLQPFTFDPNEKNKHKFMVQSVFAPDTDINIEQIWREIGAEQLMDSKLKCVFEMPIEQDAGDDEPAAKISPKAAAAATAGNAANANPVATATHLETELRSATSEIQALAEEASSLRAENLRLKEQLLHVRMEKRTTSNAGGGATKYQPAMPVSQSVLMKQLVTSVLVIIIGYILGKYVL